MSKCDCSCNYCGTGEHCGSKKCGQEYSSKTKRGECMNEYCLNQRIDGSRHCADCSYNYAKNKYEKN